MLPQPPPVVHFTVRSGVTPSEPEVHGTLWWGKREGKRERKREGKREGKRKASVLRGTGGRCSRSVLQQLAASQRKVTASTRVVVLSHALLGRGKLSRAYCVGGHDHPSDMPPGMSVVHALRVCSIFCL